MLQIRPINIQARLQATRDAASCCKQIAIPLAQRITLWCPNLLKRVLPQPSSRVMLRSIGCLHTTSLPWDSGSCRPQTQVYKPLFPAFFSQFLEYPGTQGGAVQLYASDTRLSLRRREQVFTCLSKSYKENMDISSTRSSSDEEIIVLLNEERRRQCRRYLAYIFFVVTYVCSARLFCVWVPPSCVLL